MTVDDDEFPVGEATGVGLEAQIVLGDGAGGLLDAGDEVRFELFKSARLRLTEVGRLEVAGIHDLGHVHAEVAGDADARVTLATSSGVMLTTLRSGTRFTVCQAPTGLTCLNVEAGEVEWEAHGATEIYTAGQSAFAEAGDPPNPARCVPEDVIDEWFAGARRNQDERALSQVVNEAPECTAVAPSTTISDPDLPPVDAAAVDEAVFAAAGFPRSVVEAVVNERTVTLTGWVFDEAARQQVVAAAGAPGVDQVLDRTELMTADQQCTETVSSRPNWVCLIGATFDGETISALYVGSPDAGAPPWTIEGIHVHLFGDNIPVVGAGTEGPVSDGTGAWIPWADPRSFTGTVADIGSPDGVPAKLCARVATATHTLESLEGGNCWPIAAIS